MKKILTLTTLLLSITSFAENYEHGELLMGHFSFDSKLNSSEVAEVGKKVLAEDSNFNSLAVVGTDKNEFGLYFQYKKNNNVKDQKEFVKIYHEKMKKLSNGHNNGHSISDGIIVLK